MKKSLTLFIAALMTVFGFSLYALDISKLEKAGPNDEWFMDMAVTAAKKSVASKQAPSGAVIILNGAWRATGTPEGNKTPEENAYAKSRLENLANAVVYTVNEPTTATVNFLSQLGVEAIYFANPRDVVVAAGIYPASAYDDAAITATRVAPMYLLTFDEASNLLK